MTARLNQIRIEGFKSIREADLELRRLNALIGGNGSGKSNFIGLFGFLNDIVEGRLQLSARKAGGADTLLHFGRKRTPKMALHLRSGMNGYRIELAATTDDGLAFELEQCEFWGQGYDQPDVHPAERGHLESVLPGAAKKHPGKVADHVLRLLKSWRIYHFHDTSESAPVKGLGAIEDNERLRENAENLAAFLLAVSQQAPAQYQQILTTVRMVAPFFDDFRLRESPLSPGKIKLEWRENGSDAYINAHSMSDGTLRFVCLATLLLQPDLPGTILLDEPELGLHPYAIEVLAALLRRAAQRTQVIVSTQSVSLVNQFGPEDLLVVERDQGATVFKRPTPDEGWQEEYGLGDLWEKNVLGGRPWR
ncbi:MAG: AAA family ATPase [Myxococcales bacterium]|nr:AAA family ATPase [Myxococcales bacterium]